jgi:hypothetical protein
MHELATNIDLASVVVKNGGNIFRRKFVLGVHE